MIYCLQSLANFPLELSFRHETAAKAFLVGTSGPKGQVEFWQNTIGVFIIFALWVREPDPRSSSFHFSGLALPLVPALACSRLRDSGESVHFSRSRASYFCVPLLIFVPSQLSESLEQAIPAPDVLSS